MAVSISTPSVVVEGSTSTVIPKLTPKEIAKDWRETPSYVTADERVEYTELLKLEAFSARQLLRFLYLDRKMEIERAVNGDLVYIYYGGNEYHKVSCPMLAHKNVMLIAKDRAKLAFFPCSKCNP